MKLKYLLIVLIYASTVNRLPVRMIGLDDLRGLFQA